VELHVRARPGRHADTDLDYFFAGPKGDVPPRSGA
jgi:hypothetical protein